MSYNLQHNYRPIQNEWTFFMNRGDSEELYFKKKSILVVDDEASQIATITYKIASGKMVDGQFVPALGNETGVICTFVHDPRITDIKFSGSGSERHVQIGPGISQTGVGFVNIMQQLFNACNATILEPKLFPNFEAWNSKRNINVENEQVNMFYAQPPEQQIIQGQ